MATKILDSWALIAFFEDEPAAEQVEKLLTQASAERHKLLLSVVNWGEIYYNTMRELSPEAAEPQARAMATLPIEIVGVGEDLAPGRPPSTKRSTKCPTPTASLPRWPRSTIPNSSPATRNSGRWKRKSRSTG